MGFFKRRAKNEQANDTTSDKQEKELLQQTYPNDARETIAENDARQQRKILTAYALGGEQLDEIISTHDCAFDDAYRHDVLDMVATGQVDGIKQRFLSKITSPVEANGFEQTLNTLSSNYEKAILAWMTRGNTQQYENLDESDMLAFKRDFRTPMDFESYGDKFLNRVEETSGREVRDQFFIAMEYFKRKVYGKQQEYWEQMKKLDYEADVQYEREHSHEWVPGYSASKQCSAAQVAAGMVTRDRLEYGSWRADDSCADTLFDGDKSKERQIYALFDGVSGLPNARFASETCRDGFEAISDKYPTMETGGSMQHALDATNNYLLVEKANHNMDLTAQSTGIVAKVENRGGREMISFASVGDSRIYIVDWHGNARQLTKDENEPLLNGVLTNSLGQRPTGLSICKQFGDVDWRKGDMAVVMVSDGVSDGMTDKELGMIVKRSRGCDDAAANLVANSKKVDDRSAIVFVPDFDRL